MSKRRENIGHSQHFQPAGLGARTLLSLHSPSSLLLLLLLLLLLGCHRLNTSE